jgi:hypothetical protein
MSYLVAEILLRLAKALTALVVGAVVYMILTGPLGAAGSPELALLAWLGGAAFILLVESSPI